MSSPRRIEDFRSDLGPDEVDQGRAGFVRSLSTLAYLHALPAFLHMRQLTEYLQGRRQMAPDKAPLAGWVVMRELADPATTTVSPNVDTLYGAAYVLLDRQGPVVLSIPAISDRYYSVALLDAYFGNFAIIGCRTVGSAGGNYLIAPPGWTGDVPDGLAGTYVAPTPAVCVLQRIYTRDPAEYGDLHRMQDGITLTPLDRWRRGDTGSPAVEVSEFDIPAMRSTTDPLQYFAYTNLYTGLNPPPHSDAGLAAAFCSVGVGPGSRVPEDDLTRAAIVEGARDAQAAVDAAISNPRTRGGWRLPERSAGRVDAPMLARAAVQTTQMGLLPLEEAVYFFAYDDGAGHRLNGQSPCEIRFAPGTLPPHEQLGFWSVTMYGADSLLVANDIDRYVIRPDTPGLHFGDDGSFAVRLQHERPDDHAAANWLPAPPGPYNVALRIYLPQPTVLDGSWTPPAITTLVPASLQGREVRA